MNKKKVIYLVIALLLGVSISSFVSISNSQKRNKDTVKDIDGNIYKTVKIGEQIWMAENLKVTKYNDGTELPLVTDNKVWASNYNNGATNPMMCYYDNDISNTSNYGALYNWYAVSNSTNGGKNICPTGWHVPSDVEWTALTDYIGGSKDTAKKLKSTNGWKDGGNGTDDYGFSGVPGGFRSRLGGFHSIHSDGSWWSSTTSNTSNSVLNRELNYYHDPVYSISSWKEKGYSVRCIQD